MIKRGEIIKIRETTVVHKKGKIYNPQDKVGIVVEAVALNKALKYIIPQTAAASESVKSTINLYLSGNKLLRDFEVLKIVIGDEKFYFTEKDVEYINPGVPTVEQ